MRILVTGGSGFIGTNLIQHLHKTHDVINFDNKAPKNIEHTSYWTKGDIECLDQVLEVYREFKPELVFHLAARTDLHGESASDYAANTIGVRNVIAGAASIGQNLHTVYASSRLVFDISHVPAHDFDYLPTTPYGESKVETEQIIRNEAHQGGSWTIVRPTSIWGPWFDIPYRDFFDTVRSRKYMKIIGRNPQKTYGFVGNAVHELVQLGMAPTDDVHGKVFWLTDYEPLALDDWADAIADGFSVNQPNRVPFWVLQAVAMVGDALKRLGYKEPPLTSFRLSNILTEMVYDAESTKQIVGMLPYSTLDGVNETVKWMSKTQSETRS